MVPCRWKLYVPQICRSSYWLHMTVNIHYCNLCMRLRAVFIVTTKRPCRSVLNGEQTETKERTTKKQACFLDVAPPNRHPPSQSARTHANQLAAPHRPCPGGDVTRTSGSARTQTEATEKLRAASRGGARRQEGILWLSPPPALE